MRGYLSKLKDFDHKDALLIAGVVLVFHGIHMLLPAAAYVALGAAIVWFALFAGKR